jgi:hypothetical protein
LRLQGGEVHFESNPYKQKTMNSLNNTSSVIPPSKEARNAIHTGMDVSRIFKSVVNLLKGILNKTINGLVQEPYGS